MVPRKLAPPVVLFPHGCRFNVRSPTDRSGRDPLCKQALLGPEETQPYSSGGVSVETRASATLQQIRREMQKLEEN